MSRVVILKIGEGNFATGFSVTLEIRDNHRLIAPFAEGFETRSAQKSH